MLDYMLVGWVKKSVTPLITTNLNVIILIDVYYLQLLLNLKKKKSK